MLIFKFFFNLNSMLKTKQVDTKSFWGKFVYFPGLKRKKNVSKRCEMCFVVLTDSGKQKLHIYLSLKSIQIKHMH